MNIALSAPQGWNGEWFYDLSDEVWNEMNQYNLSNKSRDIGSFNILKPYFSVSQTCGNWQNYAAGVWLG